jgi:iron complex outermembrane recepter protein
MELNGNYSTKQLYGNFILKSNYCINLGFQRNILNDKGVIKVAVIDILNTSNGGSYAKYSNIDLDVKNSSDSRRLNVSFSYRFGKDTFKTRANRSTSSSEEESRSLK